MPLPFIVGGIAAVAGIIGTGTAIKGGIQMKEANDTIEIAKDIQKEAIEELEEANKKTTKTMDSLGKKELEILKSFSYFSDLIERIQRRPEFRNVNIEGVKIPNFDAEDIKKVSLGAEMALTGIGAGATGAFGGVAAGGATYAAVMALGTASTGTAIGTLSGIAATNATLAALGGGAIAAGGGGMALGSAVLGGATLGVGLLVGGIVFSITGSNLSEKADEAYRQANKTKEEVNKIVSYLEDLNRTAKDYKNKMKEMEKLYKKYLSMLASIVDTKENWNSFTESEKTITQNTILLVGILHKMCKLNLVIKNKEKDKMNKINVSGVNKMKKEADTIKREIREVA